MSDRKPPTPGPWARSHGGPWTFRADGRTAEAGDGHVTITHSPAAYHDVVVRVDEDRFLANYRTAADNGYNETDALHLAVEWCWDDALRGVSRG